MLKIEEGQRWLTRGGFEVIVKEFEDVYRMALVTLVDDDEDWYVVSSKTGKEDPNHDLPGDLLRCIE